MRFFNGLFSRRRAERAAAIERENGREPISWGRTASARGELRFHIFTAHLLNLALLIMCFAILYFNRRSLDEFAQNGFAVFQVENGVATARNAADYRTAATDEEIQALALKFVFLIAAADSQSVESDFREAARLMTPAMRYEFEEKLGEAVEEIKSLSIYQKFEKAKVRPMEAADFPNGDGEPTRCDAVVEGRLDAYREASNELIKTGPVAYAAHMVPLKRRTPANPSALLVASMTKLEAKKKQADLK